MDERDLLTTELSDYNDLCFETCILEGTSYVTDRPDFVQNGKWKTIVDIVRSLWVRVPSVHSIFIKIEN